MSKETTCAGCRFWDMFPYRADRGLCRRNPPVVRTMQSADCDWPDTSGDDWCGAFEREPIDPPWYLNERTRETGERWPEPCSTFVNVDPDEYPDQPGCDRCGHSKGAHR